MITNSVKDDIKSAMKSGDTFKRDTLRMLSSAFKQVEVDKRVEIDDKIACEIIQSEIKKRNDSATQYKAANRDELAQKELKEIEILSSYLPKQLNESELEAEISAVIKSLNANSLKDLGEVIKVSREKIGAKSDGKSISQMAKKLLS
ncbi:GatB/YqeY domain-containing protein [Campylobacter corcagiensis]|uniref:GatB/YqeY domain-containing protein n=1 Tax=Campylobacter corcagiensis TaxID=1448857 RepID=A0A7M1LHT1_9BACT|nr:GatB/YqeY domain-containing protein [Campylobacter corcagiensis]QKF64388.1 GatB/YqeY family protein [Campylobacter corcagiensis]QOQ87426.1 GatB/YqeY domain-containing protein [Campylobacter corcagiensis]